MKYRFSFTASNAMIPEFIKVANNVHNGEDPDELSNSVLGREKGATNKRQFQEMRKRIKTLTAPQIKILSEGTIDEQKHITHLALCKTYGIYRDFVTDVLYEKVQVYDQQLSELDMNSFFSKKKMDHPELEALAESTEKKVRQVIYRMLQQVGIIDSVSNPSILIPTLSTRVKNVIINDDPNWLRCFLQNN
ncbi:DUF1819 family protein [Gracilimonas sediminicola]|uniref:DUF1819 family protein n=1 Tax=Gracilimonas sediminicola TaxID=2952158 RepID=UPI0038D35603